MSSPKNAIEVRSLTKRFRQRAVQGGYTTLKTQLVSLFKRSGREPAAGAQIDILQGVDLEVPAGLTVALIGRNGSGKSTLLKILAGIYTPTSGIFRIEGRVAALLELGAGFHPEFTGRENILMSGVILGLSRAEIRALTPEIIAFSELEAFIDQPVRNYSSGMFTRLAFSVAVHVDPDILIVDEILAVGDEHFSRKSRSKMEAFKARGKTILLVTHDLGTAVDWCDRVAWLEQGRIQMFGDPRRVIGAYREKLALEEVAAASGSTVDDDPVRGPAPDTTSVATSGPEADKPPSESPAPEDSERWGNGSARITSARLLDGDGRPATVLTPESPLTLEVRYSAASRIEDYVFGVAFFDQEKRHIFGTNTLIDDVSLPDVLPTPEGTLRFVVDRLGLNEGNYVVDLAIHAKNGVAYDYRRRLLRFAVRSEVADGGLVHLFHSWNLEASPALPTSASDPNHSPPPER